MYGASLSPTPWWSFMTPPAPSIACTASAQIRSCRSMASGPPSGTMKRPYIIVPHGYQWLKWTLSASPCSAYGASTASFTAR